MNSRGNTDPRLGWLAVALAAIAWLYALGCWWASQKG